VGPSDSPLRANVELKARLASREAAVAVARGLGAEDQGEELQTDTYFTTGAERLKLRESSSGAHWLIRYSRPDRTEARKSQYRLTAVKDPASFGAILAKQWGVRAVVRKVRHLFLWQGRVRIHLDRVDGLGEFLEFEAVLDPARPEYDEEAARRDVAELVRAFGVRDEDLVPTSYSTLVMQASGVPTGT
jgi:predicted adenylyl cyclase CyaB